MSPRSVGVAMVAGCDVTIAHRPTEQIWLIHRVDEQQDLPEYRHVDWEKPSATHSIIAGMESCI